MTVTTTISSPVGPITLAGHDGVLTGLYMDDQRHAPMAREDWARDDDAFADVAAQLDAYFAGTLTTFDLELDTSAGTPFQQRVWATLRTIPYGETMSYGQLAAEIGQPTASRAVGMANGRNPIGIIVPCHRVVGSKGDLTGYAGGLDRKRRLLDLEQKVASSLMRRA